MDYTELRPAGRSERRCIIRHHLGLANNLVVGAKYSFHLSGKTSLDDVFKAGLHYCLSKHPFLSTSIQDPGSETPIFVRPKTLQLNNHLHFCAPQRAEAEEGQLLKKLLTDLNNEPCAYRVGIPAWKLVVQPLSADENKAAFWAFFSYSHSHGDGKSSLAFHGTLLKGLQMALVAGTILSSEAVETVDMPPLVPSLEEAAKLSISWSYLLAPLLRVYAPSFISSALGIKTAANSDVHAWKALPCTYDPATHRTELETVTVDGTTLSRLLQVCRAHSTRLTGLLHQAVVYALSQQLSKVDSRVTFTAGTPIDLRKLVPALSENDMVNCFSAVFEVHQAHPMIRPDDNIIMSDAVWAEARKTTTLLTQRTSTLQDQPIGLLRYLNNFRAYTLDQLGKEREDTYEVSNIGSFEVEEKNFSCTIEKVVFTQPGKPTGAAINFNIVSKRGGDLTITLTWQRGILGVDNEQHFMDTVKRDFEAFLMTASRSEK